MKTNAGFFFQKETKTNFTKVPNQIFSLEIDPYSKLILIYLQSKPDDFIHYQLVIARTLGISRQTVARCLKDLSNSGYLNTYDGKRYSLMLTRLTSNVNQINIPHVKMATDDVKMPTSMLTKLTCDVNQINTNKKTDIIRLNNKTEKTLNHPTPCQATVDKVYQKEDNHNVHPNMTDNIKEIIKHLNEETIIKFNQLNTISQEKLISKFNLEYDEELQLKMYLKRYSNKINKVAPTILSSQESKSVKVDIPQCDNSALSDESSAPNRQVQDTYDMFETIDRF